jgi:hypothetical protein
MARYEVSEKVTTTSGKKRFYDIANIPLVSDPVNAPTIYGDVSYTWDPAATTVYENRTFLVHKIPANAYITYHDINIFGHEAPQVSISDDTNFNSFYVSNCYYLSKKINWDRTNFGSSFLHHQFLSPELLIDSSSTYGYNHFHLFPEPGAGQIDPRITDGPRFRVVNYNDAPYEATPKTYSAPYVFTSMHYQHLTLRQRFSLDSPNENCPHYFYLAFRIYGKNLTLRPLIFCSRLEWFV